VLAVGAQRLRQLPFLGADAHRQAGPAQGRTAADRAGPMSAELRATGETDRKRDPSQLPNSPRRSCRSPGWSPMG
jgi:hypothetical protein